MASEAGSSNLPNALSSSSFDAYNAELQSAGLGAVKLSVALPSDIAFHRSMDKEFAQALDACAERVLGLTNSLLRLVATNDTTRAKGKLRLENQDDVVDSFDSVVVDAMDHLFERTYMRYLKDICLDEYLGHSKPTAVEVKATPAALTLVASSSRQGRLDPTLTHAAHLPKPQLNFFRKVDNSNHNIWRPTLRHKYNAQVPLGYNLHPADADGDVCMAPLSPHPYRHEITHITYPRRIFNHTDPVPPRSFEETPFTWVDTPAALEALLEKLRVATEIAVDLEHHSYRTYAGFLCLMQISTRTEDFVIDTLALREELEELNEVFTDPCIVKVFHGAESDIVWLQQDFNLYIVNLFDTFHASKVLDFPRHGLAALLAMYCDFIPDKRYQLADWRIRPLPQEMLQYARSDTHFLLYIYDNLRNALLDRAGGAVGLVRTVLERSEQTALRVHEPEVYDEGAGGGPSGWATLAAKWNKALGGVQMCVFRCVHAWRDRVAREEDESTRYVLPNHYMFQLAEHPPADMATLLAVFRPVPPVVRVRARELLDMIRAALRTHMLQPPASLGSVEHSAPVVSPPVEVSASVVAVPEVPVALNYQVRIWGGPNNDGVTIAASSSSLLGGCRSTARASRQLYSATQSALFAPAPPPPSTKITASRYLEVVSRIHSALVIAPSLPKILGDSASKSPPPPEPSLVPEQIEIPYVPAAQRQQIAPEIDDTVVVIGQVRQKKRKRTKAQPDSGAGSNESTPVPIVAADGALRKKSKMKSEDLEDAEAEEPFDYSSVPNMLDGQPGARTAVARKQRQKKGGVFEYGDFPAPPRAYSEVKGGNRSHTFR